ncbi:hypothetical protein BY996DRAFT_6611674 [Phakopsora pachyrhizi]|nr:hypothetical protein BY996DRAFT_6611674 [Phakopsora pachyrhizi]
MWRELGPASFMLGDEEAKVEMKLMVKGPLRLKSDERIKPRKEQQVQKDQRQATIGRHRIGRFKRQEKHKLVKDWPSLELRECYKVVVVMDGCRDLPKLHPELFDPKFDPQLPRYNTFVGQMDLTHSGQKMMRRQQDTVAGMVEDLSEEVEELSAGWDSRKSYRPGWIVSTAITGVQTTTELVRITSSIKLRRLRGRDVIDGRSWSKAMKLEKHQGFVDGVLEVIREKSEAINGAGKEMDSLCAVQVIGDRIRTIKGLKDKEGKIKDKDRIKIIKGLKDRERKI